MAEFDDRLIPLMVVSTVFKTSRRYLGFALLFIGLLSAAYAQPLEQLVDSKPSLAMQQLRQQLAVNPDDATALFLQARALENLGRKQQAIVQYQQLIERQPQSPEPYVNLAALYAADGKVELARQTLSDGAQAHPGFAKLFANLRHINGTLAARAYQQALNKETKPAAIKLSRTAQLSVPEREVVVKEVVREVVKEVPVEVVREVVREVVKEQPVVQQPAEVVSVAALPDLQDTVLAWAKAWSAQDVSAYTSFYADNYAPGQLSHAQWRQDRQDKLTNKQFIEVSVSRFEQELNGDQIEVSFYQNYRSNVVVDTIRKQLIFERQAGEWRIVSETVLGR